MGRRQGWEFMIHCKGDNSTRSGADTESRSGCARAGHTSSVAMDQVRSGTPHAAGREGGQGWRRLEGPSMGSRRIRTGGAE